MPIFDDLLAGGHKMFFGRECELYRHYVQVTEEFYQREADQEKAAIDEFTKDMSSDDAGEVWSWQGEYYQRVTEDFPQLTRRSTLVAVFAFWAAEHRSIAEWILRSMSLRHGVGDAGLRYRDFSGSLYDKSRTMLTRYAGIPDDPALWQQLRRFAEVRHLIVHSGGILPPEEKMSKKLTEALSNLSDRGVSVNDYRTIQVEPDSILALLDAAEAYVNDLLDKCETFFEGLKPVSE